MKLTSIRHVSGFDVARPISIGMMLGIMLPLVLLPLLSIFVYGFGKGPGVFWSSLVAPEAVFALKLSMVTSFWATAFNVLFGLFAAYVLSRYDFWGRNAVIVTISLPTAIPTAVAGFALLLLWGKYGMIGRHFSENHQIMFTPYAIILANIFVTFPLAFGVIKPVFDTMSRSLEEASATIGATRWQTFWHVTLPSLRGAIVSGALLTFARAVGVRGVSKRFKKSRVLEDISFDVAEGESLVLLGASGSGKTTILRIMAGLEQPDSGRVILHGKDVTDLPARERGVGVIFQAYALFPRMTVEKNIAYGLKIRHHPRKERRETVDRLIKLVQLEQHRKKYPSQLSGGQQQRVAIARTLAYKPQVLLFDEPFGALDAQTRVHLRREIRALLRQVKVPSIFITHDQEEALELGDRIAVLNNGHLEQVGTPDEVYNHPATEFVATFLGAANLLLGVVSNGAVQIGTARLPAEKETQKFRDGQSVKLVFRPEDVCLSPDANLPGNCRRLANGVIQEVNFVGAYERLNVRLDLATRPQTGELAPVYQVTINTLEKMTGVPILATRPKPEAHTTRYKPGDRVAVGLTSFSLLPNYTLARQR